MEQQELIQLERAMAEAVAEYIADEEAFTDNTLLAIDTDSLTAVLVDADNEDETPANVLYYPVMDLICACAGAPGQWEPDADAIHDTAAEALQ